MPCFNTSHVVVYRYASSRCINLFPGFNTSHVVVYHTAWHHTGALYNSFNTSHVVVYQTTVSSTYSTKTFQYISCCSLSIIYTGISVFQCSFQYISCCSLSNSTFVSLPTISVSIHLML